MFFAHSQKLWLLLISLFGAAIIAFGCGTQQTDPNEATETIDQNEAPDADEAAESEENIGTEDSVENEEGMEEQNKEDQEDQEDHEDHAAEDSKEEYADEDKTDENTQDEDAVENGDGDEATAEENDGGAASEESNEESETSTGDTAYSVVLQQDLQGNIAQSDNLPQEVQEWVEENGQTEFHGAMEAEGDTYVLVAMGEVSTGGHAVELEQVTAAGGQLTIEVRYVKPDSGVMTIQVISYPVLLLKVEGSYPDISVDIQR